MQKISFNEDWKYCRLGEEQKRKISLPHDAMRYEPREESPFGHHVGFFAGRDYLYEKEFTLPKELRNKALTLEFEGVYRNAEIYLNGEKLYSRPYGYTNFYVELTDRVKERNLLQVIARNADQPNSRWYSGAGIYRPVWLWYAEPERHIVLNGVKIETVSLEPARVRFRIAVCGEGSVSLSVSDGTNEVFQQSVRTLKGRAEIVAQIRSARLWSAENPFLYTYRVTFGSDTEIGTFGIRTISCTPERGFCINGKRTILKGCCIHSDNGLLGAADYAFAAERKVRLLKGAGYNAVRASHNPCSKAFLAACDKLGMLVVDEYVDMWYIHKNKYDYANFVADYYRQDISDMVEKDYNHPSVILYSTGNEVSETVQKRGIAFARELTELFHALDSTRPVTCGINLFFNFLSAIGMGFYSEKKAEKPPTQKKEQKKPKRKKAVGSEFFNNLAGFFGSDTMKVFAALPCCDWATRRAFANVDVAGYNYGITRYRKDLKKYPNRLILGSETFISDAYQAYELAKKNLRILGDFAWAGMDYIGEVALGSLDYADYALDFDKSAGWLTAGAGCLDITGQSQGHTAYTRVVYEREKIAIAVHPVNHTGEGHVASAWRKIHAFESWSWNGFDGNRAVIEVYTRAYRVKIFLNGKKIADRKRGRTCRMKFKTIYHGGELKAVGCDKNGNELYEKSLHTAGEETVLKAEAERTTVKQDELVYVRFRYTDAAGTLKPLARGDIRISVTGGELLAFGNACPYNERGYLSNVSDTYFGEALAIVKPTSRSVTVEGDSLYGTARALISVTEET